MSENDDMSALRKMATAEELYQALQSCSFALAKLVAATGAFTDEYAKALDQATAALAKADGQ